MCFSYSLYNSGGRMGQLNVFTIFVVTLRIIRSKTQNSYCKIFNNKSSEIFNNIHIVKSCNKLREFVAFHFCFLSSAEKNGTFYCPIHYLQYSRPWSRLDSSKLWEILLLTSHYCFIPLGRQKVVGFFFLSLWVHFSEDQDQ